MAMKSTEWHEGFRAGKQPVESCPYANQGAQESYDWHAGWLAAQGEASKPIRTPVTPSRIAPRKAEISKVKHYKVGRVLTRIQPWVGSLIMFIGVLILFAPDTGIWGLLCLAVGLGLIHTSELFLAIFDQSTATQKILAILEKKDSQ